MSRDRRGTEDELTVAIHLVAEGGVSVVGESAEELQDFEEVLTKLVVLDLLIKFVDNDCFRVDVEWVILLFSVHDVTHDDWGGKENVSHVPGSIIDCIRQSNIKQFILTHLLLSLLCIGRQELNDRRLHLQTGGRPILVESLHGVELA